MTKYVGTLASNTTVYICDINKKRDLTTWNAGVMVYGSFGGGTVGLFISPDGGTTKIAMYDASGVAITSTANDDYTICFGGGATNSDAPKLYATMSGATAPSVTVAIYDNNG